MKVEVCFKLEKTIFTKIPEPDWCQNLDQETLALDVAYVIPWVPLAFVFQYETSQAQVQLHLQSDFRVTPRMCPGILRMMGVPFKIRTRNERGFRKQSSLSLRLSK